MCPCVEMRYGNVMTLKDGFLAVTKNEPQGPFLNRQCTSSFKCLFCYVSRVVLLEDAADKIVSRPAGKACLPLVANV